MVHDLCEDVDETESKCELFRVDTLLFTRCPRCAVTLALTPIHGSRLAWNSLAKAKMCTERQSVHEPKCRRCKNKSTTVCETKGWRFRRKSYFIFSWTYWWWWRSMTSVSLEQVVNDNRHVRYSTVTSSGSYQFSVFNSWDCYAIIRTRRERERWCQWNRSSSEFPQYTLAISRHSHRARCSVHCC